MWHLVAAEPAGQDGQTAIILGVIGLLTAVMVAVASGVFSLLSAKQNRTSAAPSPAVPLADGNGVAVLRERIAVLERRADDCDDRHELLDRRVDQIEDERDRA